MFDNEPEDIFAEADKVAPQVPPPTAPPVAPPPAAPAAPASLPSREILENPKSNIQNPNFSAPPTAPLPPSPSFPWKPILLVVAILVVVAAAFYLSVRILSSRTPVTPEPPAEGVREEGVGKREENTVRDNVESDSTTQPLPPAPELRRAGNDSTTPAVSTIDTDKDGLTDAEEAEAGTSPRAADTDGDELFDFEEINTWKTNPLNPDTDGDTYTDGQEVKGGYNPNGSGKLLEPPTESD